MKQYDRHKYHLLTDGTALSAHYTIDVHEILSITGLMLGEVSIEAIVQCVGAWLGSADYFVSLFGAP